MEFTWSLAPKLRSLYGVYVEFSSQIAEFTWSLHGVYMEFTWSLHGVYLSNSEVYMEFTSQISEFTLSLPPK